MTPRALSRTAAVATLALLPLATTAPAAAEPGTAPSTVSTAEVPGDVVSAQRIHAPGFWYARVWQIRYRSTDTHGHPMTVSGTVIVPHSGPEPRPVIGYAPGTHGLGDQCAPSVNLAEGDEFEGGLIHQYALRGFAVAVTDYQGLGTPGDHTYMVARAAGHALLDIVRAARRLTDAGLPTDGPVGLAGYSQGGHAASWGAQLAPRYAPELAVKGVVSGGTPVNLRQVAAANEGGPDFGLVLAAGIGMDAAYPGLDLESYLNEAGRDGIAALRDSCDFSPYSGKRITDYTVDNPLETVRWQRTLDAQNLGGLTPAVPVLLYHSTHDEIIPYSGAQSLRRQWCGRGANVTFWTYYLTEHATTAAIASPAVTAWLADRLADHPTSATC